MGDRLAHMTTAQRDAVRTVDRSVVVSAAAGSGKTTVLAERCAALVCDEPASKRCRVDELLVVTFTDAAAVEMRNRIRDAVQDRLKASPRDAHLCEQAYLVDAASISTIHAFCRSLIQRWFPRAGVDPQASVLDADEAELLRREVLDALFVERYGADDDAARRFQNLVDEYGDGEDRLVAEMVLALHDYLNSLADPDGWLENARRAVDAHDPAGWFADLDAHQRRRMRRELALQVEDLSDQAATIRRCWPVAAMHAEAIDEHRHRLEEWLADLSDETGEAWDDVAAEIRGFAFERARARPRNLSDEDKAAYDAAKAPRDEMKKRFITRLQEGICAFTAEEYREGMARIAPYVEALAELVRAFEQRYGEAKAAQACVDFNDLQRCALRVLSDQGDPSRPSDVARQLQRQYRHVLVDEFQDVDPLQEAILRLVSRESGDPPQGNFFTVGDVKQSIYRFRLAEPRLLIERTERFSEGDGLGTVIHLHDNFRSRPEVIDAVNAVFEPLMTRAFGGCEYDEANRLYAGARYPETASAVFGRPAVEVHLLEPVTRATRVVSDDDDDDEPDSGDAPTGVEDEELAGIEREAWLIGRRIRAWMGSEPGTSPMHVTTRPATPGGAPGTRPITYGDIVILLRAMPHKAEPIAEVLRRMGVPVEIGRDDSDLDSTEFRDLVSLLSMMDNGFQDIPLAAVLRSPLLGTPFSEADLLSIRLLDRGSPFHLVARRYVIEGDDADLRERLGHVLTTIGRYRERARQASLADALWEIYEENEYLAYVSGLPDGRRRRDQLVRLHELARQFGRFSRQGLRRFLRFVEEMVARDRSPQPPSNTGEENVVRILTVHGSKGLEFPVVILADVQKAFNLGRSQGVMLTDRELGIGLSAVDRERRIRYPTLLHQVVAERTRREDLAEELRLLYVALTRAREHLVLVGRERPETVMLHRDRRRRAGEPARRLPQLQLETASNPLVWLLPAWSAAPPGVVRWPGEPEGAASLFDIRTYTRQETDEWKLADPVDTTRDQELQRIARLEPLPSDEPVADPDEAREIVRAVSASYPAMELTTLPSRMSVSELKRRWEAGLEQDERVQATFRRAARPPSPAFAPREPGLDPAERGVATHRFLQLVDLTRPCALDDLAAQRAELIDVGRLTRADADAVMLEAVAWFLETDLGRRLRGDVAAVRREVPFVSRVDPASCDPAVSAMDERDVVLVRGMIDVLWVDTDELEIIDYKTDTVDAEGCRARADSYHPQIDHYAKAAGTIYGRPVKASWLVFLHPRELVRLDG